MTHRRAYWAALLLAGGVLQAGHPMTAAAQTALDSPGGASASAKPVPGKTGTASANPDRTAGEREKPLQYAIFYRLDARGGSGTAAPAFQLAGLEAEFVGSYGRKWEFAGQVPLGSQFAARGRGMHYGNLFLLRKWRLGAPTVKLGQFVVPFSNLTSYDVHNRLIQTLFRYSLGVRIDPGVEVEGYLPGNAEWQVAISTGTGPYRLDHAGTPLLTGRVSRKFEEHGNAIRLGLSAAAGTLPVFSVSGEPVSVEGARVLGWMNKRRLALDAEVEHGVDLFHLEGAAGTDGTRAAGGLWAGWTRPLNAANSLEAAVETWQQPEANGHLWGAWLGGEHRLDGARTARVALRWSQGRENGRGRTELSLMAQYVRQF